MKRAKSVIIAAGLLAGSVSVAAQDVEGVSFDVSITEGAVPPVNERVSGLIRSQIGRGWLTRDRARLDLHGARAASPSTAEGGAADSVSMLVSIGVDRRIDFTLVAHSRKKFFPVGKMTRQMARMTESTPQKPAVRVAVPVLQVESLGSGPVVSGFATQRYRLNTEYVVSVMGPAGQLEQRIQIRSEGSYAPELSDFALAFNGTREWTSAGGTFITVDSAAIAQLERVLMAVPGIPLESEERLRMTVMDMDLAINRRTTLSNVRRARFTAKIFEVPPDYVEGPP